MGFNWDAWVGRSSASVGNCWEFLRLVLREALGAELPPFLDDVVALRTAAPRVTGWQTVALTTAQPFDVLVFDMSVRRPPHVGVVVEPGLFLHCLKGGESVVESYHRKFWRDRVSEVYHYNR
ncbi:MAG: C40 family peptidase [Gammaproteobacteria bacterium]|nr:C40 family peptidase [Gammaproteobacteria bacterium]